MTAKVVAAISHKGGTGRSVTIANVAYHLVKTMRQSVLIVDLDLASPTMGSIFAVQGYEAGVKSPGEPNAPRSVHDMLVHGDEPVAEMVLDLKEPLKAAFGTDKNAQRFGLIPGYSPGGDSVLEQGLGKGLKHILEPLKRNFTYDWVLLDIRSGLSDVMEALTNPNHGCAGVVDLVLVHFRWTKQHLAGLEAILSDNKRLGAMSEKKVALVRTAYTEPEHEDTLLRSFMQKEHKELQARFKQITFHGKRLVEDSLLETIPLDPRLRWREAVLWDRYGENDPSKQTVEAYARLADKIRTRVPS